MVELNARDQKQLLDLLISLPILANEKGREAVVESSGLQELRPQLDLSGQPAVAIPLTIRTLRLYGRLDYEQEALGRFLNTIKAYVGVEQQEFLDSIITAYGLMTPIAKSSAKVDWVVPVSSQEVLEKIIDENTLRPIAFLQQGLDASRAVAYIEVVAGAEKWSGTGFLISPKLLMTNHHVLPEPGLLATTIFRFNYQRDFRGNPEISKDYKAGDKGIYCDSEGLDYVIVELEGDPGDEWGYLTLTPQLPLPDSRVNIIQHPNGLPKQISMQNNFVKFADATRIQYVTSTQPGSSGSPVFDDNWEVVGLHRRGGWLPEKGEGPLYFRNEGTALRAILVNLPNEVSRNLRVSD